MKRTFRFKEGEGTNHYYLEDIDVFLHEYLTNDEGIVRKDWKVTIIVEPSQKETKK